MTAIRPSKKSRIAITIIRHPAKTTHPVQRIRLSSRRQPSEGGASAMPTGPRSSARDDVAAALSGGHRGGVGPHDHGVRDADDLVHGQAGAARVLADRLGA